MHYIITALGCKVNQYEAQAIETLLHAHGFTAAADGEPVDLIVVNTARHGGGRRKSRQMIRKLREEHPQALCAVCGCWSQLSPEDAASIGADVVHGSRSKQAFVGVTFCVRSVSTRPSRAWIIRSSALTLSRCRRARLRPHARDAEDPGRLQ